MHSVKFRIKLTLYEEQKRSFCTLNLICLIFDILYVNQYEYCPNKKVLPKLDIIERLFLLVNPVPCCSLAVPCVNYQKISLIAKISWIAMHCGPARVNIFKLLLQVEGKYIPIYIFFVTVRIWQSMF